MHNPDFYPEPERFNPDRFLTEDGLRINPNVRNPTTLAFGFGRRFVPTGAIESNFAQLICNAPLCRICPGRFFSSASLFITIASTLHTMNILPIVGEDGKPFDLRKVEIDGILMCVFNSVS